MYTFMYMTCTFITLQRYINNTGLARADGMLTKGLEITLTKGLEITFARTSCSHL